MAREAAMQTQKRTSAKDRVWTGVPNAKQRRKRADIDPDLVSLLECGGVWLGEKGTLGGIIAQLERGGPGGGMPNTHPYKDEQIGWGRTGESIGQVERHRWLSTAWFAISPKSQQVLIGRVAPPPAEYRSDEGYGARDKFVEGQHPLGDRPVQELGKRGKPIKRKQFEARLARWQREADRISAAACRTSVVAQLGEWANLAIMLCANPKELLDACKSPSGKNSSVRKKAVDDARAAFVSAHAEWLESKAGADPMRTREQRVKVVSK